MYSLTPAGLGRGAWESPLQSEIEINLVWQSLTISYHKEFVSWHVDHFSFILFFSTKERGGEGQALSGKF